MPLLAEPSGKLAGIFTDANEFRGKIEAQNQYFQRRSFDKIVAPIVKKQTIGLIISYFKSTSIR